MTRLFGVMAAIIAFNIVSVLFGASAATIICLCITGLVFAFVGIFLWDRHKVRRLQLSFCDDAIKYARKKRLAYGDPDFTENELSAMNRARGRGDLHRIQSEIRASNQRIRARQTTVQPVDGRPAR